VAVIVSAAKRSRVISSQWSKERSLAGSGLQSQSCPQLTAKVEEQARRFLNSAQGFIYKGVVL
jgi:hypothetical protein